MQYIQTHSNKIVARMAAATTVTGGGQLARCGVITSAPAYACIHTCMHARHTYSSMGVGGGRALKQQLQLLLRADSLPMCVVTPASMHAYTNTIMHAHSNSIAAHAEAAHSCGSRNNSDSLSMWRHQPAGMCKHTYMQARYKHTQTNQTASQYTRRRMTAATTVTGGGQLGQ